MTQLSKSTSTAIKDDSYEEFQKLPLDTSRYGLVIGCYKGFWFPHFLFQLLLSMNKNFHATDTDVVLATIPKSGTVWLKALVFSIINRNKYSPKTSPLLHYNPHKLVPSIEKALYNPTAENLAFNNMNSPRILGTHIPYECLPETILQSDCRIVYLSRNLLDVVNSGRHFTIENGFYSAGQSPTTLDEYVDTCIEGKHPYGPFCNHMLGYWNASLKNPEKVMFLKYEDLIRDAIYFVKKIANFLGYPFSKEEEESGLVEEITKLCSFENLRNLEVNKVGVLEKMNNAKNSSFFRNGKVGDWKNHLTPSMAERLKNLMGEKFYGSGLTWEIHET